MTILITNSKVPQRRKRLLLRWMIAKCLRVITLLSPGTAHALAAHISCAEQCVVIYVALTYIYISNTWPTVNVTAYQPWKFVFKKDLKLLNNSSFWYRTCKVFILFQILMNIIHTIVTMISLSLKLQYIFIMLIFSFGKSANRIL